MDKLLIGWGETDITPNGAVALQGQFAERISEYVEKPLTATAMAVECENNIAIFCGVDLVEVTWALRDKILERVRNLCSEIDTTKVILSAIHNHTGPGYTGRGYDLTIKYLGEEYTAGNVLKKLTPDGKKYAESAPISDNKNILSSEQITLHLVEKIAEAIITAWNDRKKAGFSNAFGRAAIGMCRRSTYSDGSALMWGDTNTATFESIEGGNDSGVELMYVFDENKKLTGIVANVACPAQCVQHRLFISPDFWGETKKLLREHFGQDIFMLPLCSAAGDQCPVDLIRWTEPESDVNDPNITRKNPLKRKADPSMFDIAGMKKVGRRLATEIINVYEDGFGEIQTEIEFEHRVCIMPLPLRRVTPEEIVKAKKSIEEFFEKKEGSTNFFDVAKLLVDTGVVRRAMVQEKMEVVDIECHFIKMGSVAFVTNPFELFLDYGNKIRARSHAEQTFIIQLANGHEGYLPTEKAEKGGHYSAYVGSGLIGHEGGDLLVRETLKNINEMFK